MLKDTDFWSERILDDGFCVIPGLAAPETIAGLHEDLHPVIESAPFCSGDFYGYRTKRIGSLARRSRHATALILDPLIIRLANRFLGPTCDTIQLNVAQLIEIHPGEIEQFPHRDDDMWPIAKAGSEFLLNVIWPLDPFTAENGATRLYPGTHRQHIACLDELGEPLVALCEPGSAICFLGSTIHGAGANRSKSVRRAVIIGYSLGWLKPHENPWLSYPPEIAAKFPPELAALAGYVQHRPNLGNYEGQCPTRLFDCEADKDGRPTDALRPDQAEMVGAYAAAQRDLR